MGKADMKGIFENNHKAIVDMVCDKLGSGLSWSKPWTCEAATLTVQVNHEGKPYSGSNQMHLRLTAWAKDYTDNRWFTFAKARELGYKVCKGEKASMIEHWGKRWAFISDGKVVKMGWGEPKQETPEGCTLKTWMAPHKYSLVFNACQLDGIERATSKPISKRKAYPIIDRLITSSPVVVSEVKGDEAYCSFIGDKPIKIVVPAREQFAKVDEFASTVAHEMTHSTSADLKRETGKKFGCEKYAREELVAEFGSMFVCADLGIDFMHKVEREENSAAYIENWLKRSGKGDRYEIIYKAAQDAQKAAALIKERYEQTAKADSNVA